MFQLRACDFCDDIFGETADICFGDAWLPSFDREWRGTNIVLSRNAFLDGFLTAGVERNDLWLDDLSVDDLINSQAGSFRHRWFGMSVRLPEAGKHGEPVPLKRKGSYSRRVSFFRRRVVLLRQRMSRQSHRLFLEAKNRGDFGIFEAGMSVNLRKLNIFHKFGDLARSLYIFRGTIERILTIVSKIKR